MNEGEDEYEEAQEPYHMGFDKDDKDDRPTIELREDTPHSLSVPSLTTNASQREEFSRTVTQLSTQRSEEEAKKSLRKRIPKRGQATRVFFLDDESPLEMHRVSREDIFYTLLNAAEKPTVHVNKFGRRFSGIADAQHKNTEYYRLAELLDELELLDEYASGEDGASDPREEEKGEVVFEESVPSAETPSHAAASTRATSTQKG